MALYPIEILSFDGFSSPYQVLFTLKRKATLSVVPIKLLDALNPELPVVLHWLVKFTNPPPLDKKIESFESLIF